MTLASTFALSLGLSVHQQRIGFAIGVVLISIAAILFGVDAKRNRRSKEAAGPKSAAEALDELIAEGIALVGVPDDAPYRAPEFNRFNRDMGIRHKLGRYAPQFLPAWMRRDETHPVEPFEFRGDESSDSRERRESVNRHHEVRRDIEVLSEFRRELPS